MRNALGGETSPYLLQHKDNPVHWQPWSQETLAAAKRDDRPILVSIGYAACHWCHVMAHESFESPDIARLMNARFVNIKVDREERPDLDAIYQSALSLLGDGLFDFVLAVCVRGKHALGVPADGACASVDDREAPAEESNECRRRQLAMILRA